MKINAALFSLIAVLVCTLALTGCSRDPKNADPVQSDVELELASPDALPDEDKTTPEKTDSDDTDPAKEPDKLFEKKDDVSPADSPAVTTPSKDDSSSEKPVDETAEQAAPQLAPQPHSQPMQPSILNLPQELQTRPEKELKNNPNKLDTRLYAVFKNVIEQNFSRKKGTLSVYRLNFDGTEGVYELKFDINNAYDENGYLNKNAAVSASMKVAETMQSNYNYGQGTTETYATYAQYRETLDWLQSPLLMEGFALENFSDLTLTVEDGHYLIEATYSSAALNKLYQQEIYGTVQSYLQLDAQGNLEVLAWEQTEIIDDYPTVTSRSEYTFQ